MHSKAYPTPDGFGRLTCIEQRMHEHAPALDRVVERVGEIIEQQPAIAAEMLRSGTWKMSELTKRFLDGVVETLGTCKARGRELGVNAMEFDLSTGQKDGFIHLRG
ncbi:MAG: hypothetical protein QOE70_6740 [Chthoniobacter sp.]|nr:hypothetical protein [Chthoniobacter sp.]